MSLSGLNSAGSEHTPPNKISSPPYGATASTQSPLRPRYDLRVHEGRLKGHRDKHCRVDTQLVERRTGLRH